MRSNALRSQRHLRKELQRVGIHPEFLEEQRRKSLQHWRPSKLFWLLAAIGLSASMGAGIMYAIGRLWH